MKKEYDEVDLVDYIKLMYKKRLLVLAIVIAGMLFAGINNLCKPLLYEASATFFPMTMTNTVKQEGFGTKPQTDIKDLIIAVLESRKMADKITEELELKKIWGMKNNTAAQGALRGAVKTSIEQRGLIKLSVQTDSPELSARIANAYVDSLEYFNQQLDIGAQRNIVQVIDRASVPQERMPRNTVKNTLMAGAIFFALAVFAVFFIEFMKKSNLRQRLREE